MRDLLRKGRRLDAPPGRRPSRRGRRGADGGGEASAAATSGGQSEALPLRAQGPAAPVEGRVRIVVLGAGYAGLTAFLELQERLSRRYDLVLVSGSPYHWFTTELHTYVAGEPEEAVRVPLRRLIAPPGRLVVDRVEAIDPEARRVRLAGGEPLAWDFLIVGLGSDPEYYGLPGAAEHGLIVGTWTGAAQLRGRVEALVGGGAGGPRPHVVVAGGGLTGVEVAAELADEYPDRLRLTIVEAGPEIMAGFAPDLVRTAREVLQAKGITVLTGRPIARVEPRRVHFQDGGALEADLLVWAGGVRGSAVVERSGLAVTPRGRAKVDRYLRAEGHEAIYVVGDAAAFVPEGEERELPPTAQAAVQMGRAAARNLLRTLQGAPLQPFRPQIRGSFASLGRAEGVGQLRGGWSVTGLPAVMVKGMVEGHHAWEVGGGVLPLIHRILRAPARALRRAATRPRPAPVPRPAARPEPRPAQIPARDPPGRPEPRRGE